MPDLPASMETTAVVAVGGTYDGTLEVRGDHDWVRLDIETDQRLWIFLGGPELGFNEPRLRLFDAQGLEVTRNPDPFGAREYLDATAGQTFYIEASTYSPQMIGDYKISVVPLSVPVAAPPVPQGPLTSIIGTQTVADDVIRLYIGGAGANFDGITGEGFTQYERLKIVTILQDLQTYADVRFTLEVHPEAADIRLVLDTNELPMGSWGYVYGQDAGNLAGVAVLNGTLLDRTMGGNLEAGGAGYATLTRALLQALGLTNPADDSGGSAVMTGVVGADDFGLWNLNQGIYTALSVNGGLLTGRANGPSDDQSGFQAGPMALDIAALQLIFGTTERATGSDIYVMPAQSGPGVGWQAIWDTGGTDRIVFDGKANATLDLRAATLQYGPGGGGFVSRADGVSGGFTIANGVVIEQAYGGFGNDRMVGNSANNILLGRNGNDVVLGLNGHDILNGGNGNDVVQGGAGSDRVFGQAGNDALFGDAGFDLLNGGAGNDMFIYRRISDSLTPAAERDVISDFTRGQDRINLAQLDGHLRQGGNQAFNFIGGAGFDGADRQGDVRIQYLSHGGVIVAVDQDGDGYGDMQIVVQNVQTLTASDFIL